MHRRTTMRQPYCHTGRLNHQQQVHHRQCCRHSYLAPRRNLLIPHAHLADGTALATAAGLMSLSAAAALLLQKLRRNAELLSQSDQQLRSFQQQHADRDQQIADLSALATKHASMLSEKATRLQSTERQLAEVKRKLEESQQETAVLRQQQWAAASKLIALEARLAAAQEELQQLRKVSWPLAGFGIEQGVCSRGYTSTSALLVIVLDPQAAVSEPQWISTWT